MPFLFRQPLFTLNIAPPGPMGAMGPASPPGSPGRRHRLALGRGLPSLEKVPDRVLLPPENDRCDQCRFSRGRLDSIDSSAEVTPPPLRFASHVLPQEK